MTIERIVLWTNLKGLKKRLDKALGKTKISVKNRKGPLKNLKKFRPKPDHFYVIAYSKFPKKMLRLIATQAEFSSNILAAFPRPSFGVTSQNKMLGNITFFSEESIVPGVLQKTCEALEAFGYRTLH